jgi:hypothetical protein
MAKMWAAMRKIKPDSVLLSEVFGPVYYGVCNLVHDNQTEGPQYVLEQMEAGRLNAEHYKKHMANVFDALPRGANRVYYARNHDTSWFYHFNGYTPRFMALEAVHALCVIPEIFAGDPRHGPSPDDDPATHDYYRRLFALRKDYPELAGGELLLREVESDNPWVFTALRRAKGESLLVVVSLSDKAEIATVQMQTPPRTGDVQLLDPISGETVKVETEYGRQRGIKLRIEPFGVLVGRL